jgi:2'-5' RNA ligase superfamily protein
MEPTYILTAELDPGSFAWLDSLRRNHFPAERNLLPAHLTLFHRLSPAQMARISEFVTPATSLLMLFDGPVLLGFGVAIGVRSPTLEGLRSRARAFMGGDFSRQDSQPWRPHVTIQNKVSANAARALHEQLEQDFSQRSGTVEGLLIWEYLGGPWRLVQRRAFGPNATT